MSSPRLHARRNGVVASLLAVTAVLVAAVPMPAQAKSSIKITKATFAKEITSDFTAKGVTTAFATTDTVNILLRIKGRPKSGVIESTFSFRGDEIGKASVDLAKINKGVLFSIGEDTFAKFFLKPGPSGLIIGKSYAVDVKTDGVAAGHYTFSVVPPKGALASKVTNAWLSNAEGGDEMDTFVRTDTVYLSFVADLGLSTWIEADWTINGKPAPEATRSLTLKENKKAVPGSFSFIPKGGWPKGTHSVTLIMNDEVLGTLEFTV